MHGSDISAGFRRGVSVFDEAGINPGEVEAWPFPGIVGFGGDEDMLPDKWKERPAVPLCPEVLRTFG
jgi:hypothetical protein